MDMVRDKDVSNIEMGHSQDNIDKAPIEGRLTQSVGNSGVILAASVGTMAISMVVSLIIVRQLTVDDYGRYSYYLRIYTLLAFIAGFGLATKMMTDAAIASGTKSQQGINRKFYNLLFLRLLTVTVLVIAGVVLAWIREEPLFIAAAVGASFLLLRMMFSAFLQGQQRVLAVAITLLAQPFCFLMLLLLISAADALSIFLMFIASILFATIVGATLSVKYGLSWPRKVKLSLGYMKSSVEFGGQVAIIAFLQMLYESGPVLLLGTLGLFSVAATLSAPLNLVLLIPAAILPILTIVFYPRLRRQIAAGSLEVDGFIRSYVGLIGALALIPIAVMIAQPQTIVDLLFTSKYAESAPVLVVLSFLALFLLIERTLTWVLIGYDMLTAAFRVLLLRLFILAVGIVIAVVFGGDLLAMMIALFFIASSAIAVISQLWCLRRKVILRPTIVHLAAIALVSVTLTIAISALLPNMLPSLIVLFLVTIVAMIPTAVYALGMLLPAIKSTKSIGENSPNDREREFV